ncbi:hypothetical protein BMS3Abin05_00182 [bacterium BMS3Abin05]|nr:hypothetical protein BMS3Abin05_00182 [bacterium BMS3Abin05]GBE27426.1 hypothetical protein BMS3Bbin03_01351 [bacterium BMS3Bbin03]HDK35438.1 hypothetical protein [Bacteroidota bacterium]HDZ12569.1 hypothetical protein [Bacteroidota bacterium]
MKNWYSDLKKRYDSFDEPTQILHVVSDLQKAKNLFEINKTSAVNHCYRALILLDYILADKKWKAKRGELLRLREAIGSLIVGQTPYATIEQILSATVQLNAKAYKTIRVFKDHH